MSKKADKEVMEMRKTLLEKKASLLASEKPVYVAGKFFRSEVAYQRGEFAVATATKAQLLSGVKSLFAHEESAKVLSMDTNHLNFSVEDWIKDFKTRKAVLDRVDNLAIVNTIETELKKLLTQTQLREIGIADIAEAIKSI